MASKCTPPTKKELEWIEDFKKLAKRCPKKLWLYSASGTLHVMKTPNDGNEILDGIGGGVNPENSIDTIKISNDGGDW